MDNSAISHRQHVLPRSGPVAQPCPARGAGKPTGLWIAGQQAGVMEKSPVEHQSWVFNTLWWTYKKQWKDPPFLMGKSTISMAIFNCYVSSPEGIHFWVMYGRNCNGDCFSCCFRKKPWRKWFHQSWDKFFLNLDARVEKFTSSTVQLHPKLAAWMAQHEKCRW